MTAKTEISAKRRRAINTLRAEIEREVDFDADAKLQLLRCSISLRHCIEESISTEQRHCSTEINNVVLKFRQSGEEFLLAVDHVERPKNSSPTDYVRAVCDAIMVKSKSSLSRYCKLSRELLVGLECADLAGCLKEAEDATIEASQTLYSVIQYAPENERKEYKVNIAARLISIDLLFQGELARGLPFETPFAYEIALGSLSEECQRIVASQHETSSRISEYATEIDSVKKSFDDILTSLQESRFDLEKEDAAIGNIEREIDAFLSNESH